MVSTKNKLQRFAENLSLPNIFENFDFHEPVLYKSFSESVNFKGKWDSEYFNNSYPLTLELACGGGEYCLGLSEIYSKKNLIGIDIKGARMWKGAKKAFQEKKTQVAFLRSKIELIPHFFSKGEINEIWITFPDPFIKSKKASKRLTSSYYLSIYKQILAIGALIHLKTDDDTLYKFTLNVIDEDDALILLYKNEDIYSSEVEFPELSFKTHYEQKHLANGKKIKYIRYQYSPLNE